MELEQIPRPRNDVQVILDVIGRRGSSIELSQMLDLGSTDLRGYSFVEGDFHGVAFFGTHLEGASLIASDLTESIFSDAHLVDAFMDYADLEGAVFINTDPTLARGLEPDQLADATIISLPEDSVSEL